MAWKPGQSGNLKGRPPSTTALAEYIRANVEPKRLADIALSIAEDVQVAEKDRLAAVKFLGDHGWSKPKIVIDTDGDKPKPLDLSKLTTEELMLLEKIDAAQDDDGDTSTD